MARKDISEKLIHFTKGESDDVAFSNIQSILKERRIISSSGCIKGGHSCVCFTEAPLSELAEGLLNPVAYSRYSQFGVILEKKWVFQKGGRPVIYQSDSEYIELPDSHKWRHVRYEPNETSPIDFTWEREWRIRTDELLFDSESASVVVPDSVWADRLAETYELGEDFKILEYSQIMDENLARQYRDEFDWVVYTLR
ncbi:MAG TPA: hypothetical protein VN226_00870 [Anaerolineales bacterium]|nr:hypothetical protein [Anaerolineales bacterium]